MPDKFSLESLLNEAAGGAPAEPSEEVEETEEVGEVEDVTETEETETVTEEVPQEKPTTETPKVEKPNTPKKDNPIKELRTKYNEESKARAKISNILERFTDGDYNFKLKDFKGEDGKLDYDKLAEAMDDADTKVKAEKNNISPETQKELDRITAEKQELAKERLRIDMDRALTNMQLELSLSSKDINQFFVDSLAAKRNPYQWLAMGGSITDLYYIVYRDKLTKTKIDSAVAEERSKWETPTRAPASNPAPTKQQSSIKQDGLQLEQLLKAASEKIK